MTQPYVIDTAQPVTLPVIGQDGVLPVTRVFCVGRNYAAHAAEMGHDAAKEPPFFFLKPATAVIPPGVPFRYPTYADEVHFEVELVVAIGQGGREIPQAEALAHVYGYGVGIDMTLRGVQAQLKKQGRPWEAAKAFDGSAPISALQPASIIGHPRRGAITLHQGDALRQSGDLSQMIWSVPAFIAHLSQSFALLPGDLIMTGTPAGVGPLDRGDRLTAVVERVGSLTLDVV